MKSSTYINYPSEMMPKYQSFFGKPSWPEIPEKSILYFIGLLSREC
jgi:hypothetical protein